MPIRIHSQRIIFVSMLWCASQATHTRPHVKNLVVLHEARRHDAPAQCRIQVMSDPAFHVISLDESSRNSDADFLVQSSLTHTCRSRMIVRDGGGRRGGGGGDLYFITFLFSSQTVLSSTRTPSIHHLVDLMVKASASRVEDPGFETRLRRDFSRSSHTSDLKKMALQWLTCQAPGVIWSVLGLVGPVSVYCDWVRWKVWSATSISVWQHVKLSEQIRPWDTLAWCWDVKQPTNKIPHQ